MGQSLFKKHSKLENFDEMLYCGITRFRNVKLGVFRQCQNTKITLKKNMRQNRFKELSKFQKVQLSKEVFNLRRNERHLKASFETLMTVLLS